MNNELSAALPAPRETASTPTSCWFVEEDESGKDQTGGPWYLADLIPDHGGWRTNDPNKAHLYTHEQADAVAQALSYFHSPFSWSEWKATEHVFIGVEAQPPESEEPHLPEVGGDTMGCSIAEFSHRCRVYIGEEQARPLPDNGLISVLCDGVRMGREYVAHAKSNSNMKALLEIRAQLATETAAREKADICLRRALQRIDGLRAELAREKERADLAEARVEQIRATAPHGWKCFHCGESFANPNLAKAHFGGDPESKTVCVMAKDRELVYQLREAQERAETAEQCFKATEERLGVIASDLHQRFKGANTIEDAFHLYDSMEGSALVAEQRAETAERELAALKAEAAKVTNAESQQQLYAAISRLRDWLTTKETPRA